MGIYLNPGNENFRRATIGEIYVDKTMMIDVTNRFIDTGNNYICISRPRRFGKTIAGNMLSAYYSRGCDSTELFAQYKIASADGYQDKLNRYNVIKIDMNSEYQIRTDKEKIIAGLTEDVREEFILQFTNVNFKENDSIAQCILKVYAVTGETFIILIDEYDVLVREQTGQKIFDEYLSLLNGLFKSDTLRPAISLACLTGILPIVRDKIQSRLNNFREYTILNAMQLSEFAGFTAEEVQELCAEYGVDYEECRRWYDGYRLNEYEIYNPEAVVMSLQLGEFGSYWGQTSSYEVISDRIRQNFEGTKDAVIRMMAGERVDVNVTSYLNTMDSFTSRDDAFTYLIHIGYLAYDRHEKTCRIPNGEVRQEWINALRKVPEEYAMTNRIIADSKELLADTLQGDEEAVAAALDRSHIHVTSNRNYNNEYGLHSAIYLAYIYALNRYTVHKELTAGKGFADVVYVPVHPEDPALIIELKRNDSAESAIDQIKEKQYFKALDHYRGNLIFVGVNYDEKDKTHTCRIDTFRKE